MCVCFGFIFGASSPKGNLNHLRRVLFKDVSPLKPGNTVVSVSTPPLLVENTYWLLYAPNSRCLTEE